MASYADILCEGSRVSIESIRFIKDGGIFFSSKVYKILGYGSSVIRVE